MKKQAINLLKYITFFAIGAFIFWLIYKDQDIEEIKEILANDVNYLWVWVSLGLGLLSHISRTIRWNYLVEALGKKPRLINTFLAVMVGYLMNMAVPRMGEISRCGVLSKYEKITFSKLIGTVVLERLIDMLMLLLLTALIVVLQFGKVITLLKENPDIKMQVMSKLTSPYTIAVLIILFSALWVFRRKFKHTNLYARLHNFWTNLLEGIRTIKSMKHKGAFIFHSVFIWLMYYLMLYVVFFSFDFTTDLNPIAGLTTFVIASYGMVAPVQAGIGAWHFMAKESLKLYGVNNGDAVIFALVVHTSMNAMILLVGLLSVVALPFVNRKDS
ncbi:flippase-like domain-containing protein [Puteibacter caeruleilacunae]|nr:flippase-like domain-containing protein [Puteibacter caeruleilacunae]